MSDTVFILGAGASKQAGAPVMEDFLDTAKDLWKSGKIKQAEDSFQKVFEGISQLQLVHSKSQLDIHNVESVFAAFEMMRTLKKFGSYSLDQIVELVNAMRQVIVQTIETTLKLPVPVREPAHAPRPYADFAHLLDYLRTVSNPSHNISIITFNYDMALDYSFFDRSKPLTLNYSLDENTEGVPVLKLHGSLNWARCSICDKVIPWSLSDYVKKYPWDISAKGETRYVTLGIGSHLNSFTHCDKNVHQEPVIVPPTWNKTQYHSKLSIVWSRAAQVLSEAENIFVIGYSLPLSDMFFRYLYALGTVGPSTLRRFWVFNPDSTGVTKSRFKELLGQGIQEPRFKYITQTFEQSIGAIRGEFR